MPPTTGTVEKNVKIAYLPQDYQLHQGRSVAEALGLSQKLEALDDPDPIY